MFLRVSILFTVLLATTGCCCCGSGGSSSSSSSGLRERLEERAVEAISERALEAATGAEDISLDSKTGTLTLKSEEGTVVFSGSKEDGGSVVLTTEDGEQVRLEGGPTSELPEGFPLDTPSTSRVSQAAVSSTPEGKTFMLGFEDDDANRDAVIAHWHGQLESLGEVTRVDADQGGTRSTTLGVEGPPKSFVMVISEGGELTVQAVVSTPATP